MGGDIKLLQEQAVAQLRSREVRVEDREAQQPALQLGDQAQRAAVRRRDQEGCAGRGGATRNGVAVVMLVFLEQMGEMGLVALPSVPDLHSGSSNIAGSSQQRPSKSADALVRYVGSGAVA